MDLAIDSAFALSSSVGTFPVRVTTFLSRSWLTLTSFKPLWSRAWRISLETSGAFGGLSEQATVNPAASATHKTAIIVSAFIVLLFPDQVLSIPSLHPSLSIKAHQSEEHTS